MKPNLALLMKLKSVMRRWLVKQVPLSLFLIVSTLSSRAESLAGSSHRLAQNTPILQAELISEGLTEQSGLSVSKREAQNKSILTEARRSFAQGDLEEALRLYTQVPTESTFYLYASEERAHVHLALNQPEQALADLENIISPVFAHRIGAEPYALYAYIQIKLCRFYSALQTIKSFKDQFRPRHSSWKQLSETGSTPHSEKLLWALLKKVSNKKGRASDALKSEDFAFLPRDLLRDKLFLQSLQQGDRIQAKVRLKNLARREILELERIFKTIQILDAEATQWVLITKEPKVSKTWETSTKPTVERDTITFPRSIEVWSDEVGASQVSVRTCESIRRRI